MWRCLKISKEISLTDEEVDVTEMILGNSLEQISDDRIAAVISRVYHKLQK